MPTSKNPDDQPRNNLPPEVQVALDALHSDFAEFVREVNDATKYPCRDMTSNTPPFATAADWDAFGKLRSRYPELYDQFRKATTGAGANPSINLRAFFDFRNGVIDSKVLRTLGHLVEIGRNHDLKPNALTLAKDQIKELLQRNLSPSVTDDWLRVACGGPDADVQQLPMFVLMEPAGPEGFNAGRAFELLDTTATRKAATAFHEGWWSGLRRQLRLAAVEAVKHPPQPTQSAKDVPEQGVEWAEGKDQASATEIAAPGGRKIAAPGKKERARAVQGKPPREPSEVDEDEESESQTQQELIDWVITLPENRPVNRPRTMKILGRSERTLRNRVRDGLLIQIGDCYTAGSIQRQLRAKE